MTAPTLSTASVRSILPTTDPEMPRACLKMGSGSAAGEFWVGQGGERRGRPPAVCSARTNEVQAGKTRRPEGLGGKGPLAALLVGHRPLRVCSLLAPCQSNPSIPNRTLPHFQTGSERGTGGVGKGTRGRMPGPDQPPIFVQAALALEEATTASIKAMPRTPSSIFG